MKIVSIPEPVNEGIKLVIHVGNDIKKVIANIITNARPYFLNNPMIHFFFHIIATIIIIPNIIAMNMKSN
jgi:hypothetical protein